MDRDGFPTLEQSETGWPKLRVPWVGGHVDVTVFEGEEFGAKPVIVIDTPSEHFSVIINGKRFE